MTQSSAQDFWKTREAGAPTEKWDSYCTSSAYGGSCYEDFPNIMNWDDSGAVEALLLAQRRQEAMEQGLPWDSLLPNPNLYIQEIDWEKRESWVLPESADWLAAREEKKHFSRGRGGGGGRNHGKWKNHDQDFRGHEYYRRHEPLSKEFQSHSLRPPGQDYGPSAPDDSFPIPTGWDDLAVDQTHSSSNLEPHGGAWADAAHGMQAAPSAPVFGNGWGSHCHAERIGSSTGWGEPPSMINPAQSERHQTFGSQRSGLPGIDPVQTPQYHYSQFVAGPEPGPGQPGCGWTGPAAQFHQSMDGCFPHESYQDNPPAWGGWKHGGGQRWKGESPVQDNGQRHGRNGANYAAATPSSNLWKQQWQPVTHGTGVYN